jgi:hypothetical protein
MYKRDSTPRSEFTLVSKELLSFWCLIKSEHLRHGRGNHEPEDGGKKNY